MGAEQSRGAVPGNGVPPGMSTLRPNLQKRFAKGIQYNMKVVIKGDRNVGKTCLFHRLQGQSYQEVYKPTQEIQVACIQWNYKVTDDVVKVEIWDIVDKGKVKKRDGLKVDTEDSAPTLDAEFIDVYKGTSGVIMMLDITKYWTYEYVQKELRKVPLDIPVIIMASHRDMEEKRAVLTEEVKSYIAELDRPTDAAAVYYMEASMKDGFGLKYLYRFFNVPFLELQRQTLLAQLRRNEEDLEAIKVELELHENTEEQDYYKFSDYLERKRKGLPAAGVCTVAAGANEAVEAPASAVAEGEVSELQDGTAMSLRSRLSEKVLQNTPLPAKLTPTSKSSHQRIDNFIPDGKLDSTFLAGSRDPSPKPSRARMVDVHLSDSDEDCEGNPQVTMDQESPDEDDLVVVYKQPVKPAQTPLADSPPAKTPTTRGQPTDPHITEPKSVYLPSKNVTVEQQVKSEKTTKPSVSQYSGDEPEPGRVEIIRDDDLSEPESKEQVVRSSTDTGRDIGIESAPLYSIDPTTVAGETRPLASDDMDVVTLEEVEIATRNITREKEITRDITRDITREISSVSDADEVAVDKKVEPNVKSHFLDLDALDKISTAPPIACQPERKPSPKPKKQAPKKAAPPKKSLMDIDLTSSDEDDPDTKSIEEPEELTKVMDTFDEPEERPVPKRVNSSGSLKLTHSLVIAATPAPQPAPQPEPALERQAFLKKEKKKKKKIAEEREAERKKEDENAEDIMVKNEKILAKKEQDDLEAFFGEEPEKKEISLPRDKAAKKKKRTKKKKAKTGTSGAPGADDYEQF